MLRELTADDVEFFIEVRPEETIISGNCSAIDPETDAATEAWVLGQLEQGNDWAWCRVAVKARWRCFEGYDTLGCCSHEGEEQFKKGGYFESMKEVALDELNRKVTRAAAALRELECE
jgi:hypothetical protein